MLLQVEIKKQTTEDNWKIFHDYTIVAQVIGYRKSGFDEQWTLKPNLSSFITELSYFTELTLMKNKGKYFLWIEGRSFYTDKEDCCTDGIPVASVQVVDDYPHP